MDAEGSKAAVQKTYSEDQVRSTLLELKRRKISLRKIAKDYFGGKVSHADIQRALDGDFPKGAAKRLAMNLTALVEVPACPDCGIGHPVDGLCKASAIYIMTAKEYAKLDNPPPVIRISEDEEIEVKKRREPKPKPPARPRARIDLPATLTDRERAAILALSPSERLRRLLRE